MVQRHCRHFLGSKPCGKNEECNSHCVKYDPISLQLLIIHLGALGAVLRSTSLLLAIKKKYPQSKITWVTDAPAEQLLRGHPWIDQILTSRSEDLLVLRALEFDIGFVIDKSLKAGGVLRSTTVDQVFGFVTDPRAGVVVPATEEAEELWHIGLSDEFKFFKNKKPETQLMAEALVLPYARDEYYLPLTAAEKELRDSRASYWSNGRPILGVNTGCSEILPNKKWTVEYHRELIQAIQKEFFLSIVLLGGPEDEQRNQRIAFGLDVIQSSTAQGLRDGLVSVAACDVILTGDSLGLHMGISQKCWVIGWFGPSCAHEIDFFGRGEAIVSKVSCSPCWKKQCSEKIKCYDQVPISDVLAALARSPMFAGRQLLPLSQPMIDSDKS